MTVLDVAVHGDQVALMLVDAETGCQRGVFAPPVPKRVERSVTRAVHRMLTDIKKRPPQLSGGQREVPAQDQVVKAHAQSVEPNVSPGVPLRASRSL